jgi:hypothetical protein
MTELKTSLSLNRIVARCMHTARRAALLLDLSAQDKDNKRLHALAIKACTIAGKWLSIYEHYS